MTEIHNLSAIEQATAIRVRDLSPVELVDHYLDRIEDIDGAIGAFVTVTAQDARVQARDAERAVRESGAPLPALHGVPTAIKDLTLTAGVPTKMGSKVFADMVPDRDDHVVIKLRLAGTISLGKTNTAELGGSCYTETDVAGPARTPWNPLLSAGGSSGGAGAAVAAGLVPFAQGSDGAGSIRIPASVNGVVGIKPSRGRVSNGPESFDLAGLCSHGPLARTVADAAVLLDAVAGSLPGDTYSVAPLPAGETFLAHVSRDPGRLLIGRSLANLYDAAVHPDCVAAWESTSRALGCLGHVVEDMAPLPIHDLPRHFRSLWSVMFAAVAISPESEHLLAPFTQMLRGEGRSIAAIDYADAVRELQRAAHLVAGVTNAYDVVLTPTLAQPPVLIGSLRDDANPNADYLAQCAFTPFTALWNLTGQPAVSVPLYWNDANLPIGIQLVGRPGGEATLLSLAAQLETAHPWYYRYRRAGAGM